jgi:hypothetical protein
VKRRLLLQSLVAVLVLRPLSWVRLLAQGSVELDAGQRAALVALAEVVLPTSLGAEGRDLVVGRFARWVREYREGADMGHGYGFARLRAASGSAPAHQYPAQFAALDALARARGRTSFAEAPANDRRALAETALNTPQRVTRLPSRPNGTNLVADFMGFYFSSTEAWDLAYRREIGRDRCRTLDGSEDRPAPLRGR